MCRHTGICVDRQMRVCRQTGLCVQTETFTGQNAGVQGCAGGCGGPDGDL